MALNLKPPMIFRVLGWRLGVWTSLSYITKLSLKKKKKMKEKKRRKRKECFPENDDSFK